MGVSPLVAIVAVVIFFAAVFLMWWFRYSEKKTVVRNVSRHPQPYLGQLSNNIYRIPLTRNYIYQTPPPTFRKAIKCPIPKRPSLQVSVINIEDMPPPTYEQYLKAQQQYDSSNDFCKTSDV